MTAAELRARGNAALEQGNLEGALDLYRQAAEADPRDAVPWLNMGFVKVEISRWAEARDCLDRAIALAAPTDGFVADAYYLRGRAQQEQGAIEGALADYYAAVAARADFAEPMESAAQLLLDLKRFEDALQWARRAAAVRPGPQADLVAAQALDRMHRPAEALELLAQVLARDPDNVIALEGRGTMLLRLGRDAEALGVFERVLSLAGESVTRLANAALASHRLGQSQDGARHAQRALGLGAATRDDAYNLSAVLLEMHRVDEALAVLAPFAARDPRDVNLAWNVANAHLLRGDLAEGFGAYESRFTCDALGWKKAPSDFGRPRWSGRESLAARSILVVGEQGLGDAIQMLRYVPLLASQASLVLLRIDPGVAPLMAELPRNCRWDSPASPPPPTDFQVPLMSLPLAFGTTLRTVPTPIPYVKADPARAGTWRKRLDALGPAPRVGIAWSGNPAHANDHNRSIPLRLFRNIAREGVQFVSLLPEVRDRDRQEYATWTGLARFGEELRDFADTAALVANLDLVVSVDTSSVHLAGALGRPVWVLLPHYPDWRWMLGRDDSPWYPTARLWRQPKPGDWNSVLGSVRGELGKLASGTPAHAR